MRRVLVGILALSVVPAALAVQPCLDERAGAGRSGDEPCLDSGYWAQINSLDDCRFTFSAGLLPTAQKKASALPVSFQVSGGRCERWPNRSLNVAGTSVLCARSGNGSAIVTLQTRRGELRRVLGPVAARRIPDEPVLETRRSPPKVQVLTLYRSRDYRQVEFGRICSSCRLLAADIQASEADATILDVALVSASESDHWLRCPARFRCGVPEFSPPNEPHVSGCAGRRVCRVWRLSDDETEARDVVQIRYQTEKAACRNCPAGVDYATARKRWEEAKIKAERACTVFPDAPAQLFGKRSSK